MVEEAVLSGQFFAENQEMKRWMELHSELDGQVESLRRRKYLTAEEEMELKMLRKRKLMAKDQIHQMMHQGG